MSKFNMELPSYDDIFSTQEERDQARQEAAGDKVVRLQLNELEDFKDHPYSVAMDEDMASLIESIKTNGLLEPVMVRPKKDGNGYELIAGHRRKFALNELGIKEVDAIVRNLDDDEATILMVDSNLHREHIYPTERGYAYKMRLDAMKHQGKKIAETSDHDGPKYRKERSNATLAELVNDSVSNIKRYIRLTYLIKPIQDMVDEKDEILKMGMVAAVEVSYLPVEEQDILYDVMSRLEATPNLAQCKKLREASKTERLDSNFVFDLLSSEKANQKTEKIDLSDESINQYFPDSYSTRQKRDLIIKLLENWSKTKDKNKAKTR